MPSNGWPEWTLTVDRSTIVPFFLRGEDRFREQKLTGALPGGRSHLSGSANARHFPKHFSVTIAPSLRLGGIAPRSRRARAWLDIANARGAGEGFRRIGEAITR